MANVANDADSSAPTWMNNEFFEKALRSGEDPNIAVTSNKITRATEAGDNYTSDIYRAVLNISKGGQTEERSIIIKTTKPGDGKVEKFIEKTKIFEKEINMFTILLPEMNRLLGEISTSESQQFTPKYIYSKKDERGTTILLEDLKTQGFRLPEMKDGLDMKHCLLVMRKIAKFHAASVVLYHKNPDRFKLFMSSYLFNKENAEDLSSFTGVIQICLNSFQSFPDYASRYSEKLSKIGNNCLEFWIAALTRDDSEFNVLTHGDLWANNLMFRYSEETGEVEDLRFVDFQMSLLTSPTADLHYFMNSSAPPEVLENTETLIEEYYRILAQTLVELGYESLQPTAKQISDKFEKGGPSGVLASLTIRTMAFVDRSNLPDMSKMMDGEEHNFLSKAYLESQKKLLPIYEKKGWI